MTFELEADQSLTPESTNNQQTVHGSIYGYTWKQPVVETCGPEQGLARVEFHTNAVFLVVAVLSAGIYVPQTVEWWCEAPAPGDDGELFLGGREGKSSSRGIDDGVLKSPAAKTRQPAAIN